jgi:hypothetical protein
MSEKYEKFSGDMSRNEVEMDLSKFMDLIQENANLKSEVAELKASDLTNPWQKWIHLRLNPVCVDSLIPIPLTPWSRRLFRPAWSAWRICKLPIVD